MSPVDPSLALLRILKRRAREAPAVLRREAAALRRSVLPGATEEAEENEAAAVRLEEGLKR